MSYKLLFITLLTLHLSLAGPTPRPRPSASQEPKPSPRSSSSNDNSQTSWSQDRGVLIHSSSSTTGKRSVAKNTKDSETSDSNSLLTFADEYDIGKQPIQMLASTFTQGDASPNVYNNGPSIVDNPDSSYKWTPVTRQAPPYEASARVDSYSNIPIVNGIRNPKILSAGASGNIYNAPSIPPPPHYGTPTPVYPAPRILYGSPSPIPEYGSHEEEQLINSEEQGGYGPGPSHQPYVPYGPAEPEEEREIRFVVHKEGDEALVKQKLSEKSKWANEHVSFVKGPQFQIEQNQKLYLPPKPKMVVYILLKEPKVHTQVNVEGEPSALEKPEVFIMYERTNGIEKTHYDLAKDGNSNNNYPSPSPNGYSYKRDTGVNSKTKSSRSSSSSDSSSSPSSINRRSSEEEQEDDESAYSADEPKTSSSNIEESVIVRKPNVVCTATM